SDFLDAITKAGFTALHVAVLNGKASIVQLLLKNNAKVNTKDESNWTVLHHACEDGHIDVVQLLLEHCSNTDFLDAITKAGSTALYLAAGNGKASIVQLLLKNNAQVHT